MELCTIRKPELVVAIDFGSTYSGYAWQWGTDFIKDRGNIKFNDNWGSGSLQQHKTKTCLLLEANGDDFKIESFGYEAERMYIDKFRDGEHSIHGKWYLLKRFKQLLYSKNFNKKMTTEDEHCQPIPLFDVVSKFIEAMKNHFIKNHGQNMNINKTLWVVTVPAIWSEEAKAFMKDAAEKSGIDKKNLLITLEPEAAAVYCLHLPSEQRTNLHDLATPGQIFLTADLGGLTTDLSAVKVLEDGTLEEVCLSYGRLAGGQNVNDAFFQALHDSFDEESWKKTFGKTERTNILQMEDEFEQQKVMIDETVRIKNIALNIPYRIMKEIEEQKVSLKENSPDVDHIFKIKDGEITFKSDFVRKILLEKTCKNICDTIKAQLKADGMEECDVLVLVGGFAKSQVVIEYITTVIEGYFSKIKVVVPTSPFHAILKGAVLYGHDPLIFRSRISRFTYGIGTHVLFDEKIHDKQMKWQNSENKKYYCRNVLDVHVVKGESVILEKELEPLKYQTVSKDQNTVKFSIYASEEVQMNSTAEDMPKSVIYTTDKGCKKIGEVIVQIPESGKTTRRTVLVRMIYGGTTLSVIAKDEKSSQEFPTSIRFDNL